MRETIHHQRPLMQAPVKHFHADELEAISHVLDSNPEISQLVLNDILRKNVSSKTGCKGMSADRVLRAFIVVLLVGKRRSHQRDKWFSGLGFRGSRYPSDENRTPHLFFLNPLIK